MTTSDPSPAAEVGRVIERLRNEDDPHESFEGNGLACRFCFARHTDPHDAECLWLNREMLSASLAQGERLQAENAELRQAHATAMDVIKRALTFHQTTHIHAVLHGPLPCLRCRVDADFAAPSPRDTP